MNTNHGYLPLTTWDYPPKIPCESTTFLESWCPNFWRLNITSRNKKMDVGAFRFMEISKVKSHTNPSCKLQTGHPGCFGGGKQHLLTSLQQKIAPENGRFWKIFFPKKSSILRFHFFCFPKFKARIFWSLEIACQLTTWWIHRDAIFAFCKWILFILDS